MDHSDGFQIPAGILPQVTTIRAGLGIIYKAPQMDVRVLNAHLEHLTSALAKINVAFVSFDINGDWEAVSAKVEAFRIDARTNKGVIFLVCPPFAQRMPLLTSYVDHIFQYATMMNGTVLTKVKVNGVGTWRTGYQSEEVIRLMPVKKTSERQKLEILLPAGLPSADALPVVERCLQEYMAKRAVEEKGILDVYLGMGNHTVVSLMPFWPALDLMLPQIVEHTHVQQGDLTLIVRVNSEVVETCRPEAPTGDVSKFPDFFDRCRQLLTEHLPTTKEHA